jgi:hypothetical protein
MFHSPIYAEVRAFQRYMKSLPALQTKRSSNKIDRPGVVSHLSPLAFPPWMSSLDQRLRPYKAAEEYSRTIPTGTAVVQITTKDISSAEHVSTIT